MLIFLSGIQHERGKQQATASADIERMEKATALIQSLTAERDSLRAKVEELQKQFEPGAGKPILCGDKL